jgi:hypothetical protein
MKTPQQHLAGAGKPVAQSLDTIAAGLKVANETMQLINLPASGFGGAPACMPNYQQLLGMQEFGIGYDPNTLLAGMGFGVDYNALLGNSCGFDFGSFNFFSW